jgi:hypothetical protein
VDECSWKNPPLAFDVLFYFISKPDDADVFCPALRGFSNRDRVSSASVILMRETIGTDFEKSRDKEKKKSALNYLKSREKKKEKIILPVQSSYAGPGRHRAAAAECRQKNAGRADRFPRY